MIALIILRVLEYALEKWESFAKLEGYPIPERLWHVTHYYASIRNKTKDVPGCWNEDTFKIGNKRRLLESVTGGARENEGSRRTLEDDYWPARMCNLALQGRSLWGPRHNPMETSLLTIMRPNLNGDSDPNIRTGAATYMEGPCYQPPDRAAPWTVAPEGEPFAPLIGAARRLTLDAPVRGWLRSQDGNARKVAESDSPVDGHYTNTTRALVDEVPAIDENEIVPGYGINVKWGRPGVCDGTSHAWCDKTLENNCYMSGAQDNRGMVCFSGLSGWLVFDIKNVKHGFIGARMEPWHSAKDVPITAGWTSVNNGGKGNYEKQGSERRLDDEYQHRLARENLETMLEEIQDDVRYAEGEDGPVPVRRQLGGGQSCGVVEDYTFEWAINGTIVSWTKAEFCDRFTRLNYNLDVIKFMDHEPQSGNFELAMRMTNVGNDGVMCISHLYWA